MDEGVDLESISVSPKKEETKQLKSSKRDNSFNEDNDEFDDIPLCEHLPKNNLYEDKIPKLELPNTLSETGTSVEKPKVSFNKANFVLKKKGGVTV